MACLAFGNKIKASLKKKKVFPPNFLPMCFFLSTTSCTDLWNGQMGRLYINLKKQIYLLHALWLQQLVWVIHSDTRPLTYKHPIFVDICLVCDMRWLTVWRVLTWVPEIPPSISPKHRPAHRFTHTWSNKRKHMRGTTRVVKPLKEAI